MGGDLKALNANAFKEVLFAIVNMFPDARKVMWKHIESEPKPQVRECVISIRKLIEEKKSHEQFCQQVGLDTLGAICAFCMLMWENLLTH